MVPWVVKLLKFAVEVRLPLTASHLLSAATPGIVIANPAATAPRARGTASRRATRLNIVPPSVTSERAEANDVDSFSRFGMRPFSPHRAAEATSARFSQKNNPHHA